MDKQVVEKFDRMYKKILTTGKKKNSVRILHVLEQLQHVDRPVFVCNSIKQNIGEYSILIKIAYWVKENEMMEFISSQFGSDPVIKIRPYRNGPYEGVLYLMLESAFDSRLLNLITLQYNYELGVAPSLHLETVVCCNLESKTILFHLIDDRWFNAYHIMK